MDFNITVLNVLLWFSVVMVAITGHLMSMTREDLIGKLRNALTALAIMWLLIVMFLGTVLIVSSNRLFA